MPITLKNCSKRIMTFNLPRSVSFAGSRPAMIVQHTVKANAKGDVAMSQQEHVVPGVLTILPGEARADLPDQVLQCPQIKRAVKQPRSGLVLVRQASKPSGPKTDKKKAASRGRKRR